MSGKTTIAWTAGRDGTAGATWNPVRGCSPVSSGCANCYAARQAHRFAGPGQPYEGLTRATRLGPMWTGRARFVPEKLAEPLHWRKPRRVFVCSMGDLFHEAVTDEQIAAVFGVMAACPQHVFQALTKRAARMLEWFRWADSHPYLDGDPGGGPLAAMADAITTTPASLPERVFGGEGDEGDAVAALGRVLGLDVAVMIDIGGPLPPVAWMRAAVADARRAC